MRTNGIVERAVEIIGDPTCREDVQQALEEIEDTRDLAVRRSKKGKAAARDLARVLRRLRVVLRNRYLFPGLGAPFSEPMLVRWINHCETTAGRSLKGSNKRTGEAERFAALKAYDLLRKYGKPVSTTKRSTFEQLAATLYGNATADFHHYVRAAVRSAKSGSK
jgi:hypothetical protein